MRSPMLLAGVAACASGALSLALLTGGCSAVLGIESDRHVVADAAPLDVTGDADGAADGGLPANWACIDDPMPTPSGATVKLKMFLNDVSTASSTNGSGNPIAGAALRACGTLDIDCEKPVATTTSDDAGMALITVPAAFAGYYEATAAGFSNSILSRATQRRDELAVQGIGSLSLIALGGKLVGVNADPNLGIAIMSAIDCNNQPAPGMTFEIAEHGAGEKLVYIAKGLPSASAAATDVSGSGAVFNVPPGTMTITVRLGASGPVVRTASTLARPGWVTYVSLRPDQGAVLPIDSTPP